MLAFSSQLCISDYPPVKYNCIGCLYHQPKMTNRSGIIMHQQGRITHCNMLICPYYSWTTSSGCSTYDMITTSHREEVGVDG